MPGGAFALFSLLKRQSEIYKPKAGLDTQLSQYSTGPKRSGLARSASTMGPRRSSAAVVVNTVAVPAMVAQAREADAEVTFGLYIIY